MRMLALSTLRLVFGQCVEQHLDRYRCAESNFITNHCSNVTTQRMCGTFKCDYAPAFAGAVSRLER